MKILLSTCGTSILTFQADFDLRSLINRNANKKIIDEIAKNEVEILRKHISTVKSQIDEYSYYDIEKRSAELNALIKYNNGHFKKNNDQHYLICTETWLGRESAEIIRSWLLKQGQQVEIVIIPDLQAEEILIFQSALSELIKWCHETIPGYKQAGYQIVFNLTGGFKSVQGFLQTLAMFYADESIYVFESGKELLRIPRLPVKLVPGEIILENLTAFRRLALGLTVEKTSQIPDSLLVTIDGQTGLSAWGDLAWNNVIDKIYSDQLLDPPSDRIIFTDSFKNSTADLRPDRLFYVNQRMDDLALFLEMDKNLGRLRFKALTGNPVPPNTHEINAWSDSDARRIFGYFSDNRFVLVKLDKGLH